MGPRGQLPGIFNNTHVELDLHRQNVITHLVDSGERIVFTPNQVSLESESGKTLDTRIDPRSAFAGQTADSKWDKLHAGYFSSYALWGYLTTPFLYTYTGFETQEIEPWHENGERWRVLQVTFPDGYAAHTRIQYVLFRRGRACQKTSLHCRYPWRVSGNELCVRISKGKWSDDSSPPTGSRLQRGSPKN